jgi:glycosyltransferase involved in cell wall biosynthesis
VAVAERSSSTEHGSGLELALDRPLPDALTVGPATAVFCAGSCFHRRRDVVDLTIAVNGVSHRPSAQRMPRLDRFKEAEQARAYRSGFWAIVPIEPRSGRGELELAVEARLDDGSTVSEPLGTIAVVDPPEPLALDGPAGRSLIAICMATYNPEIELFRAQVESIRAQTDGDWVCVISDDCSEPERFEAIAEIVADDDRFVLSRADRHLSFYRNFERALRLIPAEAELVALSDHDDRWYPDKLAALREAIGPAELAYSDLRRVGVDGTVRAETLWRGRRNNRDNLASLLISNSIVGASCMFRRRVLDHALPFPSGPGWDFHDHWLALVAMALGDLAYVDRPLYDYVQHPRAVLGRTASSAGSPRRRGLLGRWRSAYFSLYLQREFHARILLARCATSLTRRKRRGLRLLVAASRSPMAFAWLAARPARALVGRSETLGIEGVLARGVLWRHLVALRAWKPMRPGGSTEDASLPDFEPQNLGRRQRRWLAQQ